MPATNRCNDRYDDLLESLFGEWRPSYAPVSYPLDPRKGFVGLFEGIKIRGIPEIRKIYFNNKHTTIVWEDGIKTTVGCIEGQEFDEYGGFAAAILKRLFGSSSAAYRFMNEHKEVQPDTNKKSKQKNEAAVNQDA